MMNNDYEVVEFKLDVSVTPDSDTVWLTIDQMVDLFKKNKSTISRHIANIIKEGELDKNS